MQWCGFCADTRVDCHPPPPALSGTPHPRADDIGLERPAAALAEQHERVINDPRPRMS